MSDAPSYMEYDERTERAVRAIAAHGAFSEAEVRRGIAEFARHVARSPDLHLPVEWERMKACWKRGVWDTGCRPGRQWRANVAHQLWIRVAGALDQAKIDADCSRRRQSADAARGMPWPQDRRKMSHSQVARREQYRRT